MTNCFALKRTCADSEFGNFLRIQEFLDLTGSMEYFSGNGFPNQI